MDFHYAKRRIYLALTIVVVVTLFKKYCRPDHHRTSTELPPNVDRLEYHRTSKTHTHSILTLFTTLSDIKDRHVVESNVLKNWAHLTEWARLIVYTDNTSSTLSNLARSLNWTVRTIPEKNKHGAPCLIPMFKTAKEVAPADYYGYANADILLTYNVIETLLTTFEEQHFNPQFPLLLFARRFDIMYTKKTIRELHQFQDITNELKEKKSKVYIWGYDLFIGSKTLNWDLFPKFVVSRPGFDMYIPALAPIYNITMIDCTNTTTLVHQKLQSTWTQESVSSPPNMYNLYELFNHTNDKQYLSRNTTLMSIRSHMWFSRRSTNGEVTFSTENPDNWTVIERYLKVRWKSPLEFNEP